MGRFLIVLGLSILGSFVGQVLVHEVWQTWLIGACTGFFVGKVMDNVDTV